MQIDKRRRQGSFYIEILLVFKFPVENTSKYPDKEKLNIVAENTRSRLALTIM